MTTITVAIPLHRSEFWVDNVVENIRRLDRSVTRIVVSDTTCLDDAAETVSRAVADDPRVVVRSEPLGLDWITHYQLLVEQADSDLFMWMPHDDLFDRSWVPTLRDALRRHPRAWLAYGRTERVSPLDDIPLRNPLYVPAPGIVSPVNAINMMMIHGGLGVPFRGLFWRRAVLNAGIELRAARDPAADIAWVLAVALQSALVYDDRSCNLKRFYPTSAHAQWRWSRTDKPRTAIAVFRRHHPTGASGAIVGLALCAALTHWLIRRIGGLLRRAKRSARDSASKTVRRLRGRSVIPSD